MCGLGSCRDLLRRDSPHLAGRVYCVYNLWYGDVDRGVNYSCNRVMASGSIKPIDHNLSSKVGMGIYIKVWLTNYCVRHSSTSRNHNNKYPLFSSLISFFNRKEVVNSFHLEEESAWNL